MALFTSISLKDIMPAACTMSAHLCKINLHGPRMSTKIKCVTVQSYYSTFMNKTVNNTFRNHSIYHLPSCLVSKQALHLSSLNLKSKKGARKNKNNTYDDDEDDDNMIGIEDEEEGLETNASKVLFLKVSSFRLDMVLRSAFQVARNKIETQFYESKIRVNGYKVTKKSHNVSLGDEVDMIRGFSTSNPNFLVVQRIKILAASDPSQDDDEGNLTLKVRRYKSLTINNYEEDVYKESSASQP